MIGQHALLARFMPPTENIIPDEPGVMLLETFQQRSLKDAFFDTVNDPSLTNMLVQEFDFDFTEQ